MIHRHTLVLGALNIHVLLSDEPQAIKEHLLGIGVSEKVASATAHDFTPPVPPLLGTAFELRFQIVMYPTQDLYVINQVLRHEIGHIIAVNAGLQNSEPVATILGSLIEDQHIDSYLRIVREMKQKGYKFLYDSPPSKVRAGRKRDGMLAEYKEVK